MVRSIFQFLALALVSVFIPDVTGLSAQVTVAFPGIFAPEQSGAPPPAVVLGVDSQGHTTYAVEQDVLELGTNGPTATIPATATLVAGTDRTSYTYSADAPGLNLVIGFDCDLKDGNAICSDRDSNGAPETATLSSLAPFVIDVVSTTGLSVVSTAGQSGSTAQPTNKSNAAPRLAAATVSGVLVGTVLMVYSLL
ncbi:hypothetical protein MVEN_02126300 [Mycena venus]|uniref:Uncharacterized protein n=1 Tax=Mycena venus TaxID=2733690 RepID=A0A8H6X940_9AGAR|nr:hypothetical protein MVEN_02126300 [Mycena venus]